MPRPAPPPLRLRWHGVAGLVIALLFAQWLGAAHSVLHADRSAHHRHDHLHDRIHPHAVAHRSAPDCAPTEAPQPVFSERRVPTPWLGMQALFADHEDEPQCRLYDQLSHGDLIAGWQPLLMASAQPHGALPHHGAWFLAAQATGFLARAPPAQG